MWGYGGRCGGRCGVSAPLWAAAALGVAAVAVTAVVAFRVGQKVRPLVDAAREANARTPHIESVYPKWFKLADDRLISVFLAVMLLILCAFLTVATILIALGYE